ncbi:U6 snRNA phosphodiesterase [Cercospora zeina]
MAQGSNLFSNVVDLEIGKPWRWAHNNTSRLNPHAAYASLDKSSQDPQIHHHAMTLVAYSDSSDSEAEPISQKRKLATEHSQVLPPLPAAFRDLYSSTVRTSTQDDPVLHGGRKRVTPHVAGNWPTHVYLDYYSALQQLISHSQKASEQDIVHSLLENELGVQQPLHVSLSRPLSLKTDAKDVFLEQLKTRIPASGVEAFGVQPLDLAWHPNEEGTRCFLVLRLQTPSDHELKTLLNMCNTVAARFSQPLLYTDQARSSDTPPTDAHDGFHISIAWTIQLQHTEVKSGPVVVNLPDALLEPVAATPIQFSELKHIPEHGLIGCRANPHRSTVDRRSRVHSVHGSSCLLPQHNDGSPYLSTRQQ